MSDKKIGLPVGQHVLVGADILDDFVVRPYTPVFPISDDEDKGELELVVKIYKAGENKRFPTGGIMSQYLDSLKNGDSILVSFPWLVERNSVNMSIRLKVLQALFSTMAME